MMITYLEVMDDMVSSARSRLPCQRPEIATSHSLAVEYFSDNSKPDVPLVDALSGIYFLLSFFFLAPVMGGRVDSKAYTMLTIQDMNVTWLYKDQRPYPFHLIKLISITKPTTFSRPQGGDRLGPGLEVLG